LLEIISVMLPWTVKPTKGAGNALEPNELVQLYLSLSWGKLTNWRLSEPKEGS
jgi:hypothetical protein